MTGIALMRFYDYFKFDTFFLTHTLGWPAPAPPTALNIKAVYLISYSWYG